MHPIKIYCLENKISQKQFAKQLKKSENWISFIIRNKRKPSPKLAKEINRVTGIPILELLFPDQYLKNKPDKHNKKEAA